MRILEAWVRAVAIMVPADAREEWVEEWNAELAITDQPFRHAPGAFSDAWCLRTQGWTMESMLRDLRLAVRSLLRRPFFTALAGITLAIGIGANTAIFSVVDGVLLDPLPYPESDRLVSANHSAPGLNLPVVPHSEAMYLHYQAKLHTLSSFAVFAGGAVNLVAEGDPRRINGARVTQAFFDVLEVQPFLGRGFVPGEDRKGAEPVVILGYGLWQQSYGRDREVVGRLVELDGVQRRVVGVMPEGFRFPEEAEVWIPMAIDETDPAVGNLGLIGVGRLAAGSTPAGAQAEMQELLLQFADEHPEEMGRAILEQAGLGASVKPLKDLYVEDVRQALWILLGTVGFVLLIACANVANLFLVRAEARVREQALRTAMGASRGDMVRQYLTESLTLALGGGILGLGLAYLGVRGLLAMAPVAVPRASEIGIDSSVLLFTALVSLGSGFLFGLFPVLGYARKDLSGVLKEGGRGATSGRERHRARSVLVVAQVALALTLLVGSGLMARSFVEMRRIDPGFDSEGRLTFRVSLPEAEYTDALAVGSFYRTLVERLTSIPGVRSAGLVTAVPLEDQKNAGPMEAEERPVSDGELGPLVDRRQVSPGYFETMGIGLVEGRELTWEDRGDGPRSVVVSETLARTFWPGQPSAVGRRIREQGEDNPSWEIVGVARDVRFETLAQEPAPLIYLPLVEGRRDRLLPVRSVAVVLNTGSDPLGYVAGARNALREVAPRLPMVNPRTLASIESDAMAATSFTVVLLGIASAIALVLGTVGIYGVISYVVSRRTQEIGVRMALGAPGRLVLREVVGQGLALAGWGIALGLLGAWGASRVLSSLLYGVSATDPITYIGTAAGLMTVAFLAAWVPARRAARVDPVEALRAE